MIEGIMANIGLFTFPLDKSGKTPIRHLIKILKRFSNNLVVVTGNETYNALISDSDITLSLICHNAYCNRITRAISYTVTQLISSVKIVKYSKNVDKWIFWGTETLVIPIIISKVYRKRIILAFPGSTYNILRNQSDCYSEIMQLLSNCELQFGG